MRKLTEKEKQRKEYFDKICEKMKADGYDKKDLTVGVVKANVVALFLPLPFAALACTAYSRANPTGAGAADVSSGIWGIPFMYLAAIIILIVLHELLHGITWAVFAKNHFRSIDFGVSWKMITPYCTCSEPLKKWQYLLGSAMPTLILGYGLTAVAAACSSFPLLVLAVLMIFGGGGDIFIILKMLMFVPEAEDVVYYDHPYECGVVAFIKKGLY